MNCASDIPRERRAEFEGIVAMLREGADASYPDADALATRIARCSLLDGHLWRTMGLADRSQLRSLFETRFPELAAGNTRDMRWKKYLYKRLCGWPGFHG